MSTVAKFEKLSKAYGDLAVLEDIDLEIEGRELMILYGLPSSGKSVLLRLLMGLEQPDSGRIILRGQDVAKVPPKERGLRYIPQDFALFPNKSVFENIAYPLRLARTNSARIREAVERAAGMLSIQDLLQKLPTQLSGGQKQRVAIARGLVLETDIYIFDDPLAGLDFKLREQLIDDLKSLQESLEACFIYATSDPLEAMALGSRLAVLHGARVREVGPPEELYLNPAALATMDILGFPRTNFVAGELESGDQGIICRTGLFSFPVETFGEGPEPQAGDKVRVGIRPEDITTEPTDKDLRLKAEIVLKEDLGAEEIVYLRTGEGELKLVRPSHGNGGLDVGHGLELGLAAGSLIVFDRDGGHRIGLGRGA